jgi:hypothetical protein
MSSTVKPPGTIDDLAQKAQTTKHAREQEQKAQDGQPLTAAEVLAHPEYPHVYWDLPADKKGKVDVATGRGGPLKVAYEIHGHGPRKIVVSRNRIEIGKWQRMLSRCLITLAGPKIEAFILSESVWVE